jgi:hypothetical protein
MIMMMRCLVKPKRLFNSMPRAGPRDLANRALRYGAALTRLYYNILLLLLLLVFSFFKKDLLSICC